MDEDYVWTEPIDYLQKNNWAINVSKDGIGSDRAPDKLEDFFNVIMNNKADKRGNKSSIEFQDIHMPRNILLFASLSR